MKKNFLIIIILLLLCSIAYYIFINNNNIFEKEELKENFEIKKLRLVKCESVIKGRKLNGIRFFIDYIYTSPTDSKNEVVDIRIEIIYPNNLINLLKTNMITLKPLYGDLNSSKLESTCGEMYIEIPEEDINKFINQQNQFRIMVYKNNILIKDETLKNSLN